MCCLKTNTNSENQLENLFLFYLMLRPDLVPIRYQIGIIYSFCQEEREGPYLFPRAQQWISSGVLVWCCVTCASWTIFCLVSTYCIDCGVDILSHYHSNNPNIHTEYNTEYCVSFKFVTFQQKRTEIIKSTTF